MSEMREPLSGQTAESASAAAFGRREWAFLLVAAAASAGMAFAHRPLFIPTPGIGLTLTQWALVIAALSFAKREKRLLVRPGGVFLLAVSLGLGVCYGVYANDLLRAMSLPVTVLATSLALFSLTGVTKTAPLTAAGLMAGCRRFFPAFAQYAGIPVRALKTRLTRKDKRLNGVGAGILLGLPAVGVALWLLTSADGMFQAILEKAANWLENLDVFVALRLILMAIITLLLFSFLYATTKPVQENGITVRRTANAVTYATVLGMLTAVYALFVYVQFRYLFGGGDTVAVNGGYAAYARSGFFQLVLLALLTLALILPALILCADSKPLRALCAALALLTGVIDYSAFFRMRLYIEAYGYTLLRVVTMWGVGMIALALLGVIVKSIRPGIQICPALTVLTLTTWLILNLSNPSAFIARRNLTVFHKTSAQDLRYIVSLSPDALPELDQIDDPGIRNDAWRIARDVYGEAHPALYDWSLGWLNVSQLSNNQEGGIP